MERTAIRSGWRPMLLKAWEFWKVMSVAMMWPCDQLLLFFSFLVCFSGKDLWKSLKKGVAQEVGFLSTLQNLLILRCTLSSPVTPPDRHWQSPFLQHLLRIAYFVLDTLPSWRKYKISRPRKVTVCVFIVFAWVFEKGVMSGFLNIYIFCNTQQARKDRINWNTQLKACSHTKIKFSNWSW